MTDTLTTVSAVRRDAWTRAVEQMHEQAAVTLDSVISTGAALMVREPWRITRAVYLDGLPPIWPPRPDVSIHAVLSACRQKIKSEQARADHWTFDANRLIALRQAELALFAMLERGDQ